MTSKEINKYYDFLIDYIGVSKEAIDLVLSINGVNEKTFNDILYCTTGYRSIEQYEYCNDSE